MVRQKGIVIWYNAEKGFGFIKRVIDEEWINEIKSNSQKNQEFIKKARETECYEILLHYSFVNDQDLQKISEGIAVEFEVEDTIKGPLAKNVIVI